MNNLIRAKINSKITWFLTIFGILLLAYFIYKGFFSNNSLDLDASNNTYVSATKQAKDVDILNKENLDFKNNVSDIISNNTQDFSVSVEPSNFIGRDNPFIP